jgi:hypothetical protein
MILYLKKKNQLPFDILTIGTLNNERQEHIYEELLGYGVSNFNTSMKSVNKSSNHRIQNNYQ